MSFSPVRLNHAVFYVADLDRSLRFYVDVFGMDVVGEAGGGAAFLRLPRSGNHHDLGLFDVGGGELRRRGSVGLYHLAWQVDTVDELVEADRLLAAAGALVGRSNHGATLSLYGADPDGNEFEIMWMLPREAWGEYADRGVVEPLDLASELARWSGTSTAGTLVTGSSGPPVSRLP